MTDTRTARNVEYEQDAAIPASGLWTFTGRTVPPVTTMLSQGALRNAGVALWLAVSPFTAIADPWFSDRQRRASTTAGIAIEGVRRRRLTLSEALRLADEIMRNAEEGRIRAAESEAIRQFDLEIFS